MNGSTNAQVVGLAAGFATVVIWLTSYFSPGLMAEAPTGLEAALTGIFTVLAGVIFKPDAGIKALPGTGTARSPAIIGIITVLFVAAMTTGCQGTIGAYKAADGLGETAYVMREHFDQVQVQIIEANRRGEVTPAEARTLQRLITEAQEPMRDLASVARAWQGVKDAETEEQLTAALAAAAIVVADLTAYWDSVSDRPTSSLPPEVQRWSDPMLIFST